MAVVEKHRPMIDENEKEKQRSDKAAKRLRDKKDEYVPFMRTTLRILPFFHFLSYISHAGA